MALRVTGPSLLPEWIRYGTFHLQPLECLVLLQLFAYFLALHVSQVLPAHR